MSEKITVVGIDLALRGKHKAVVGRSGQKKVRKVRPFTTQLEELRLMLRQVHQMVEPDAEVEFIMEPTSHAWFPVARWLMSKEYPVYLVRPEKVADARRFVSKHAKTDSIDAKCLVWLGLHYKDHLIAARALTAEQEACFRLCKQRARYAADVGKIKTRIQSLVELAAPGLYAVLSDRFTRLGRKLLREHINPHRVARLGFERFAKMCQKAHHGPISREELTELYAVFVDASRLYTEVERNEDLDLDLETLQAEIADEMTHLSFLEGKIKKLDPKIDKLYEQIDPRKVLTSIQGIGSVIGAAITSKIGNIDDFKTIRDFRAYCGLVPRKKDTSETKRKGLKITKAGNRYLKQYLYLAAEIARLWDPELAEFYARLHYDEGKHHKKAVVAVANKLANRIYAVLKRAARQSKGTKVFYQLRNLEGKAISKAEGRRLALEILRKRKEERSSEAA